MVEITDFYPEMSGDYDIMGVHPHDIPAVGVFDEPTVQTCINAQWLSHLVSGFERFIYRDAWRGTDAEIDSAINSVLKVIAEFDKAEQGCNNNMAAYIVGEVKFLTHSNIPAGWLTCRGQAVSRNTYAALFAAIGTRYGAGDGSTTFNLPNTTRKFLAGHDFAPNSDFDLGHTGGEETHTLTIDEMPAHTHTEHVFGGASSNSTPSYAQATRDGVTGVKSTGSAGSGAAHENRPPWFVVIPIIYAGV